MYRLLIQPHSGVAKMRLLTHNLLACNAKTCITTSNNFPLRFRNIQLELIEADVNRDFLRGFMPKIEWSALVSASREVSATITLVDAAAESGPRDSLVTRRCQRSSQTSTTRCWTKRCSRRCITSFSR